MIARVPGRAVGRARACAPIPEVAPVMTTVLVAMTSPAAHRALVPGQGPSFDCPLESP
jgi:hypothetical protein